MAETWKVLVTQTREAVFYVQGDEESAREDAEVMADEIADDEWDDWDSDITVIPQAAPAGELVWTGGPQGEWEKVPE